jgi:hypothetical protein
MGRLVGMMLMHLHVEDAFWLLVATIEGYLKDYFTPTLRQLRIDAEVFEQLLHSQDPRLAQHLKRNDVMPIMYMTQWFLTLFTMSLPWASVLRVWDVFYFDGVKALFRTGLGILQLCRQYLLDHCPSSAECMDYLLHIPLEILGPEALLEKTAFRIKVKRESIKRMSAVSAGEMDAREGSTISLGSASGAASNVESMQDRRSGKIDEDIEEEDEEGGSKNDNENTEVGSDILTMATMTTTSSRITTATTATTTTTTSSISLKDVQVIDQGPLDTLTITTTPPPSSSTMDDGMNAATPRDNSLITPTVAKAGSTAISPSDTTYDYTNNINSNLIYNATNEEAMGTTAAASTTADEGAASGPALENTENETLHSNAQSENALGKDLQNAHRQPSTSRSFTTTTTTLSMSQAGAESLLSSSSSSSSASSSASAPASASMVVSATAPGATNTSPATPTSGFSALFRTRKRADTIHR